MTDEQLAQFFPKFGDRIAVKTFCQQQNTQITSGNSVLNRLREKLKIKMNKAGGNKRLGNKSGMKETRRIEVGWLNYEVEGKGPHYYHQVRTRCGGGVRHLQCPKTATTYDVMHLAVDLCFPDGESPKGKKDEFEITMMDFSHKILNSNATINEIYDEKKVKMLRLYLATKKILSESEDLEDPCDKKIKKMKKMNLTPSGAYLVDITKDKIASDTESEHQPAEHTQCVAFATEVASQGDECVLASTLQSQNESINSPEQDVASSSGGTLQDHECPLTSTPKSQSESILSIPQEMLFASLERNDETDLSTGFSMQDALLNDAIQNQIFDDTVVQFGPVNTIADLNATIPLEKQIKLHRGHVFDDFLGLVLKGEISECSNVEVTMVLPNGESDVGEDNGGILRDSGRCFMISVQWETS